jgi:hypothetical protein
MAAIGISEQSAEQRDRGAGSRKRRNSGSLAILSVHEEEFRLMVEGRGGKRRPDFSFSPLSGLIKIWANN